MSKITVAFAINDAYTRHLNIAIFSLLKNNQKNQFDIYILCKSLTKRNQSSIKKTLEYYKNAEIKIIELKDHAERFKELKLTISYISIETYYRYLLAELLPKMDRVVYLDADILVNGDISELNSMSIDEVYVAGVNDAYIARINKSLEFDNSAGYKASIGFKPNELYINAGVLVMNLKRIRHDNVTSQLFERTIRLAGKIKFQDQDVLNITMQGKMKEISNAFNYTDQDKKDDNKKITDLRIIHYTGTAKPWGNTAFIDVQIPFVELYRQYVDEYNELIHGSSVKYASYTFSTENIGDDIQAIAARRFLPRIDHYINRDSVGSWQNSSTNEHVKLIANGWYMHSPRKWPIDDSTIEPLYISMYVEQSNPETVEKFLSKESRKNFAKAGSTGARDRATYDFFKKQGIDTYLSGCVTLTLQKNQNIKKQDFIVLADVSSDVYEYVRKSTKRRVIYLTHAIASPLLQPQQREELAEMYLYLYQSAHCVITERLHAALPCLAFETPVLLIDKDVPVGGNKNRFSGLGKLANYHTENEFLTGKVYDFEVPPPNPSTYLKYRRELIKTCTKFTGFDNKESFAWTDIGEIPTDDVLAKLEIIKTVSLKNTTVELTQTIDRNNELSEILKLRNAEIERQNTEIARLMGIKAATRRLMGNVKRRIVKRGKSEK